jgi:hypothetical protein
MIYVEGVSGDGVAYAVYVDASEDELTDMGIGMPMSYGETVHGTPTIVALLRVSDGQQVPLTPTGPNRPLSSSDPESVVAWLRANTDDVAVATGDDLAAAARGDLSRGLDAASVPDPRAAPAPDPDEIVY